MSNQILDTPWQRQVESQFEPYDVLCFLALPSRKHLFIKRSEISDDTYKMLSQWNSTDNIYLAQNTFQESLVIRDKHPDVPPRSVNYKDAKLGRTKENVKTIRTVYLEVDENGVAVKARIMADPRLPQPHIVLESSPNKFQFMWFVTDMDAASQESLLKAMVTEFGCDPACVDATRVLRLAGYKNLKPSYKVDGVSPLVRIVNTCDAPRYRREDFKIKLSVAPALTSPSDTSTQTTTELLRSTASAIESVLAEAAIVHSARMRWNAADLKWQLAACPWAQNHTKIPGVFTDGDAMVGLHASGAPDFKCLHGHCADKGWAQFRAHLEKNLGRTVNVVPNSAVIAFPASPITVSRAQVPTTCGAAENVVPIEIVPTLGDIPDMPDAVLDGRLGEICQRILVPQFPMAYAWPTLVTVAGVMVPRDVPPQTAESGSFVFGSETRTNLYTAPVGPIHSGKSQAIDWARKTLGLPGENYSDIKAGSAEGLLLKMSRLPRADSRLMDIDEWKHYFEKASIDKSSFMTILNTNFYKNCVNMVIARGKEISIDCAISWIGGIVFEEYGTVVGAAALGGFYDRLYQSICPSNYVHYYKPWDGIPEAVSPVAVKIDGSVWEVTRQWQKENPALGRELEISVRVATICASFDGRRVLTGKDMESGAPRANMEYQSWVRTKLKPNAGENPNAQCANAITTWLQSHAPKGEWVDMVDLKRGLNYSRMRLGPTVFASAVMGLASPISNTIELKTVKRTNGKPQNLVRLVDDK